jgi:GNAT superfamily N-acetyltransferase
MNFNVRKATLDDLSQLAVLFDGYRMFYKKTSAVDDAAEFLSQRLSKNESEIFVADRDGTLLGFVQLYPLFSSTRMKRLWLLNDLFVEARYRGHGVSVALIDAAKNLCLETGACALSLETAKSNEIGNQLYPRAGFTLDQDHNFYSWDQT